MSCSSATPPPAGSSTGPRRPFRRRSSSWTPWRWPSANAIATTARSARRVDSSLRRRAQYTSFKLAEHLDSAGSAASIGSVGDAYDNAPTEAAIGLFKTELATAEWVDWYNHRRLHRRRASHARRQGLHGAGVGIHLPVRRSDTALDRGTRATRPRRARPQRALEGPGRADTWRWSHIVVRLDLRGCGSGGFEPTPGCGPSDVTAPRAGSAGARGGGRHRSCPRATRRAGPAARPAPQPSR